MVWSRHTTGRNDPEGNTTMKHSPDSTPRAFATALGYRYAQAVVLVGGVLARVAAPTRLPPARRPVRSDTRGRSRKHAVWSLANVSWSCCPLGRFDRSCAATTPYLFVRGARYCAGEESFCIDGERDPATPKGVDHPLLIGVGALRPSAVSESKADATGKSVKQIVWRIERHEHSGIP